MQEPILNALTFDVEEYFQVSAFENIIPTHDWDKWESRVEHATNKILDLLEASSTKATFFTLGIIAKNHPNLIQRIISEGHELACHGFQHVRVVDQNATEFAADIDKAKKTLEDLSGSAVYGYRAASFSINRIDHWAYDEMKKAGFNYSSSIYPIKHDLYGIPDAPRLPFHPIENDKFLEIPVTTFRTLERNFPAGGGGYFRLYPYIITRKLIAAFNASTAAPANMYFHPWEFDPEQPRPSGLSPKTKFRHYVNQTRSLDRLQRLVGDFHWSSMLEAYDSRIEVKNEGQIH